MDIFRLNAISNSKPNHNAMNTCVSGTPSPTRLLRKKKTLYPPQPLTEDHNSYQPVPKLPKEPSLALINKDIIRIRLVLSCLSGLETSTHIAQEQRDGGTRTRVRRRRAIRYADARFPLRSRRRRRRGGRHRGPGVALAEDAVVFFHAAGPLGEFDGLVRYILQSPVFCPRGGERGD